MEEFVSLDFESRGPQVEWGVELKAYLCCLHRYFERDDAHFKKVFDLEFQKDLQEWGFRDSIPWRRARSQLHHMPRHGDLVWEYVFLRPFDRSGPCQPTIKRIETATQVLGIQLIPKAVDDTDVSVFRRMPRLTPNQREAISPRDSVAQASPRIAQTSREEVYEDLPPSLCRKDSQSGQLCRSGGQGCFICYYERLKAAENPDKTDTSSLSLDTSLPPLLYRWGNIDSQGVNSKKLFLSSMATASQYISPSEIPEDQFVDYVSKHVHIEKFSSPFISTMRSMLTPVHRSLRNKEGAIVSIIDPTKLGADTPVYAARDLVCKLGIRIRGYTGLGEYLVWWKIPPSAIVCSFKASDLERITAECQHIREIMQLETITSFQNNRKNLKNQLRKGPGRLDQETGLIIGKLLALLQIPHGYADLVGEGIVKSWQMKQTGLWRDFVKGINEGYQFPIEGRPTAGITTGNVIEILDSGSSDIDEDDDDGSDGENEDDNGDENHNDNGGGDGDDVLSILSENNSTTTVRSPSPRLGNTFSHVEIFNPRTQHWVDSLDDENNAHMDDENQAHLNNENSQVPPSIIHDLEDDDHISIDDVSETEDTESEDQQQAGNEQPQDLFELGRARVKQFFG